MPASEFSSSILATARPDVSVGRSNPVDSYDQDLTWIIDKLTGRVGGESGLICSYLALEPYGTAIALGAGFPSNSPGLLSDIIATVRRGITNADTRDNEETQIFELTLERTATADPYQLVCLSFYPAPGVNIVAIVLRKHGAHVLSFIQRPIAKILYPVLSRYILLWWMHREERSRAVAFKATLDLSDVGIVLLDRKLELLFENSRARQLLDVCCGLRREGKFVTAELSSEGMKLQAALQHSLNNNLAQRRSPGRQPAPLLALRRGDGKRSLIVTVLGLDRAAIDARDAAVMLHIIDPSRDFSTLIAPLCAIYNLTKAETRLAYLLTSGLTLGAAAETMNVQEATARSYLKQIFLKTFTNRQADLVRLLLCSLQHINPAIELEPH